jgi:hypothetical protein
MSIHVSFDAGENALKGEFGVVRCLSHPYITMGLPAPDTSDGFGGDAKEPGNLDCRGFALQGLDLED